MPVTTHTEMGQGLQSSEDWLWELMSPLCPTPAPGLCHCLWERPPQCESTRMLRKAKPDQAGLLATRRVRARLHSALESSLAEPGCHRPSSSRASREAHPAQNEALGVVSHKGLLGDCDVSSRKETPQDLSPHLWRLLHGKGVQTHGI